MTGKRDEEEEATTRKTEENGMKKDVMVGEKTRNAREETQSKREYRLAPLQKKNIYWTLPIWKIFLLWIDVAREVSTQDIFRGISKCHMAKGSANMTMGPNTWETLHLAVGLAMESY